MDAKEFIIEDFRHFAESYLKNESNGETRVNWLIGLTTTTLGGLIALLSAEQRPSFVVLCLTVIMPALGANLVFGIVTLLRMLRRDSTTDFYQKVLNKYRAAFATQRDSPAQLDDVVAMLRQKRKRSRGGGLSDMVMAINSLVFAAICFVGAYAVLGRGTLIGWFVCYYWAGVGLCAAFYLQHAWIAGRRTGGASHAGGIVVRFNPGKLEYLLVQPKNALVADGMGKTEWVLPKGHIEGDEGPRKAAVREVEEETGVCAKILWFVGTSHFEASGEKVIAKYFLMKYLHEGRPKETRTREWCSYEVAFRKLTHKENQNLLKLANCVLAKRSPGGNTPS